MNLEKVVFGFFILLAATLNFGFVYGDIDDPLRARRVGAVRRRRRQPDRRGAEVRRPHPHRRRAPRLEPRRAPAACRRHGGLGRRPRRRRAVARRDRRGSCRSPPGRCSPTWSRSSSWWSRRRCSGAEVGSLLLVSIRRLRAPLIFLIAVFAAATAGFALIPGVDPEGDRLAADALRGLLLRHLHRDDDRLRRAALRLHRHPAHVGDGDHLLVGDRLGLPARQPARADAGQGLPGGAGHRALRARGAAGSASPSTCSAGSARPGCMVAARARPHGAPLRGARSRRGAGRPTSTSASFVTDPPAMAGDVDLARDAASLAGLAKRECVGVLALTADDRANVAIAVATRLLHPGMRMHRPRHHARGDGGDGDLRRRPRSSTPTASSPSGWRSRCGRPTPTGCSPG